MQFAPPPPFPFQPVPPEAGEVLSLAADWGPVPWKGCLLHHPAMEKGIKKGQPDRKQTQVLVWLV